MRILTLFAVSATLSACAGSDAAVEGIATSKATDRLMLGAQSPEEVAQCASAILKFPAAKIGDRYIINISAASPSPEASYQIYAANDPYTRFVTRVDVLGNIPDNTPSIGECLPIRR